MLTRDRFAVGLVLSVALLLAGLASRNRQLALLSLPPLFYCASLLIAYVTLPKPAFAARRIVDRPRVSETDTMDVALEVASHGRRRPQALVRDAIPTGMTLTGGTNEYHGPIETGSPREIIHYTLQGGRGVYAFPPITMLVWSTWGLALAEAAIAAPVELRVLPRCERLRSVRMRPRRTRAFAGPIRSNLAGAGIEFYGCRAFSPGDDIRRLNWRAFARTDELVISDYEEERITDIHLILDARVRAHAAVGVHHTFEYATQATASLASTFCAQGNNVGLLVYGDVLHWVFPGAGRAQMDRILNMLSQARLASKIAFEDLRQIPARLFPPYSQLVLVSSHLDESDMETLALLRSRGYCVLLVSVNTLPLEREGLPPSHETDLAARIAGLRRTLYLHSLARYGVQVVDWDPSGPLAEAFDVMRWERTRHTP
jgi:uncharacterized protein (DUF58 family)